MQAKAQNPKKLSAPVCTLDLITASRYYKQRPLMLYLTIAANMRHKKRKQETRAV